MLPLFAGEQFDKGIEQCANSGVSAKLTRDALAASMLMASSAGAMAGSGGCNS